MRSSAMFQMLRAVCGYSVVGARALRRSFPPGKYSPALHVVEQDGCCVRLAVAQILGRRERKCSHEDEDTAADQRKIKAIHGGQRARRRPVPLRFFQE